MRKIVALMIDAIDISFEDKNCCNIACVSWKITLKSVWQENVCFIMTANDINEVVLGAVGKKTPRSYCNRRMISQRAKMMHLETNSLSERVTYYFCLGCHFQYQRNI